jgi:tRNA dimethylallyltransferase
MPATPSSELPKIVVICGPTGVGKTGFAIALAQHLGAEIVGADSMQIYRWMDIGTAKPTPAEQAAVRHHMVDIIPPDWNFDAADYARQADEIVHRIARQSVLPLVVGGTGLYIKALLFGLFETQKPDEAVRERLRAQARQQGGAALHDRLQARDPQSAARIHPNDTFRVIRALEVLELTGRPLSQHLDDHGFARPRFDALKIGLSLPRDQLYARIERRVAQMLSEGLEDEVRGLLARGFSPELKSMQSLGYRHMIDHLAGRTDCEETMRLLRRDHRRYAKRQLTWFRADPQIHWLEPGGHAAALDLITAFLGRIK